MTLEEIIELDSRLPMLERDAEIELDAVMDIIAGNVEAADLNQFRKAGVKVAHA